MPIRGYGPEVRTKYELEGWSCDRLFDVARRVWRSSGSPGSERDVLALVRTPWLSCTEPRVPAAGRMKSWADKRAMQHVQDHVAGAYAATNAYDCEEARAEVERAKAAAASFSRSANRQLVSDARQAVRVAETSTARYCQRDR